MEGDAGTSRLTPEPDDADDTADESLAAEGVAASTESATEDSAEPTIDTTSGDEPTINGRRSARLGRGWVAALCVGLIVVAGGLTAGGYLALRAHERSADIALVEQAALQAARDCVAATHAPDAAAMAASQAKIIECSTGDFGAQANLYSAMLLDVYRMAEVSVQVSDMRAAVERHNDDGSVDVLVAMRVKVTNSAAADAEQGYRLRAQMAPDEGVYKIAELEQVTS